MTADPTTLNDLQARHAIKLFYDHLPAAVWDGGRKPGTERVATVVGALREEAEGDAGKALAALTANTPDGLAAQAALARIVLMQALEAPALAPVARAAIAGALQANMGPALEYGMMIVAMLLATTKIDRGADGWHVHLGGSAADIVSALRVPEMLDKLPAVLKALPQEILGRLGK